ncbi:hypothetical protein XACS582_14450007 [Xanthomonas citri pv. citri]|nr:hypothetical protein XAC3824_190041 [Xanthomonas citri pv. citri]CEE54231.1 hypothetical protein XAC71A_230041 [Xanthomonas citri pv. citri]CEE57414.1 hypothetical protein XACS584_1720007 [Xanthomonas citri pv. citri]CEF22715.1 hypothetical protein XACJK2_2070006 [Xanthomonas citri pv. citri]CEH49330.1 hypothetical protein XAC3615_13920005 [Xanthomonas citri pv. citri]
MQRSAFSRKAARGKVGEEVGRYALYNSAPSQGLATKSSHEGALPQRDQAEARGGNAYGGERVLRSPQCGSRI